jgi:hypothetical protein
MSPALDSSHPTPLQLALWAGAGMSLVFGVIAVGWCIVWRCVLVKLPAVREVFGLEDSVHGPRRKRRSTEGKSEN